MVDLHVVAIDADADGSASDHTNAIVHGRCWGACMPLSVRSNATEGR